MNFFNVSVPGDHAASGILHPGLFPPFRTAGDGTISWKGAKEGMGDGGRNPALPWLGLMAAVAVCEKLRISGFFCVKSFQKPAQALHIPAQIMPVALVRSCVKLRRRQPFAGSFLKNMARILTWALPHLCCFPARRRFSTASASTLAPPKSPKPAIHWPADLPPRRRGMAVSLALAGKNVRFLTSF